MNKSVIDIRLIAKDMASGVLKKFKGGLTGITKIAKGVAIGIAGITASVGVVAIGIAKIAGRGGKIAQATADFGALSESMGETSDVMLGAFTDGTRGLVNNFDAMDAGARLMSMGIVNSADEMRMVTDVATRLGDKTVDTTDNIANFALMLANQSIPRLDSFGISSGVVKTRIVELMDANKGMTRETAFMTATMEEAEKSMAILGDAMLTPGDRVEQMKIKFINFKDQLIEVFSPKLSGLIAKFQGGLEKVLGVITLLVTGDFNSKIAEAIGAFEDDEIITKIFRLRDTIKLLYGSLKLLITGDFNGKIAELMGAFEDDEIVFKILNIRNSIVELVDKGKGKIVELKLAFMGVKSIIEEHFKPAIDELKIAFGEFLEQMRPHIPMLKKVAGIIIGALGLALIGATLLIIKLVTWTLKLFTWLDKLGIRFNATKDRVKSFISDGFRPFIHTIKTVYGWVKKLITKLGQVKMPNALKNVSGVGGVISSIFGGENNATGTTFFQGGLTGINEQGGESAIFPKGTRINSAEKTSQQQPSGGATTINYYAQGDTNPNQVASNLAFLLG